MRQALTEIAWPMPPGCAKPPRWEGDGFRVGEEHRQVLCFDAPASHWTPELTALHEAEAGAHHPIDLASRRLALESMRQPGLSREPVILDVGCSSGFLLEELRRAIPRAALIGTDVILPPLRALAERLPDVPLLQFDLQRCPLPDRCVNAVTALNVLEHVQEDDAALRHLWRILKPGGVAHVEVPAGPHLYDLYDEQLLHYRRYRLSDFIAQCKSAGFTVLKATHLGALLYPAFWRAKKRNQRLQSSHAEEKRRIVAEEIRQTSGSRLLRAVLRVELAAGRWICYPQGIRCVVRLRKEATR